MNIAKLLPIVCLITMAAEQSVLGAGYPMKIAVSPEAKTAAVYKLPPPEEAAGDYDTVLINGEMPDPNVKLRIGASEPVAFEIFPGGRFWAKYRVVAGEPLEITVLGGKAARNHVITIYNLEVFIGSEQEESPSSDAASGRTPGGEKAVSFPVTWRADWGAVPVSGYSWHTPRKFTLHHTAGPRPADRAASEAEMRFIQSQHMRGNGWLDIGYHFVISPQGDIFEGRPVNVQGAHVKNHNTDNVGISVMGNYMHDPATPQILDAIVRLGQYLKTDFSIGESAFFAHRQLNATACPGDNLYAVMQQLRERIFRGVVRTEGIALSPSLGEFSAGGSASFGRLLEMAAAAD